MAKSTKKKTTIKKKAAAKAGPTATKDTKADSAAKAATKKAVAKKTAAKKTVKKKATAKTASKKKAAKKAGTKKVSAKKTATKDKKTGYSVKEGDAITITASDGVFSYDIVSPSSGMAFSFSADFEKTAKQVVFLLFEVFFASRAA